MQERYFGDTLTEAAKHGGCSASHTPNKLTTRRLHLLFFTLVITLVSKDGPGRASFCEVPGSNPCARSFWSLSSPSAIKDIQVKFKGFWEV